MSRCFPFPPPGYEKKARIDDTDLLAKEKHKEKKHKKDKKDKEKKEGKEKKDNDRSKEKHREKKGRKERHKDKDRDRDKEKNQTPDEKRVEGKSGFYIGENSGSNSLQNNEIKDSKYVQELARRIRDEDKASGSQTVQKITATDQRAAMQGMAVESNKNLQNNEIKDSKYVQELARRIRDEAKASGSQTVQKIAATDQRAAIRGMALESNIGIQSEEKKKVKDKNDDPRKPNGQRSHVDTSGLEKLFGQNLSGMDQERVEGIAKPMEKKDVEKQMEGKEKSKHKESDSKGDKHKGRDREKKRKSKDKDRDKEQKKEEKAREITESSKEQPKVKESSPKLKESSKDSLDFRIIKPSDQLRLSGMSSAGEGNLGKRKELEMNGYLLDNGNRPNKFQRPLSSSHPVIENGKKLETSQTGVQFVSEKGPANNHRADIKERKINGLIAAQHPNVCSMRPLSAHVPTNENGEASAKPPHPDTKYLSQILSVPKMEEWSDFNDQEWLFSSNHLQSKKPNKVSSAVDGTRQVWAEAMWIESADIAALPYVIPY